MPGVLATQVRRQVRIGGATKAELLQRLAGAGVQVNAIGRRLFADERFRTIEATQIVDCLQTTVAALGLPGGGTFAQATRAASEMGLSLCPLELGPHLRLELMDQPEGPVDAPQMQGRAPPGSITIASAPLGEEDDTPKGFYLRRIEGVLWLRGYRSSPDHLWSPTDVLVFARAGTAARPRQRGPIDVRLDDLSSPEVLALIAEHLAGMRGHSPPGQVHALAVERLRDADVTFWSAWQESVLCGCGALKELDARAGEVKSMRTRPAFLRQGVGQAVLDEIVRAARARNYLHLYLETGTGPAFAAAHSLYLRNGFSWCGAFGDYVATEFNVFMVKPLGPA